MKWYDTLTKDEKNPRGFKIESELGRDVRRELAQLVHEKSWGLKELRSMELSLEDIFLTVITTERGLEEQQEVEE